MTEESGLITVAEAAVMLSVAPWTVYRMQKKGALPRVEVWGVGNKPIIRVPRQAVLDYIERFTTSEPAPTAG